MKDTLYVIVSRHRIERQAKTENFTLQPGEHAFRLLVEIDDAAFAARRIPTVHMTVPVDQLISQIEVTTQETEGEPQ